MLLSFSASLPQHLGLNLLCIGMEPSDLSIKEAGREATIKNTRSEFRERAHLDGVCMSG